MEFPKISDAEWQVMKIIWKSGEITAHSIIEELEDKTGWKPKTIKSLISRLLNKNVIGFNKLGKEYLYYALVPEEECVMVEAESFIDRMFDGSLNSMLLHFVESKKLSKKDIDELKDILNKAEK